MRLYIIAGEASGDLHGGNLIKHLLIQNPELNLRCWGGDNMLKYPLSQAKHIRDLAFMGFIEVFQNLGTILNNLDFCKKDILDFKPDAIIFIDYPGFNLRICEWAKKSGFKTIYYIAPQVWAWKENRVHKIKQFVDELIVILPFEVNYFKKFGIDAFYTGHPLLDVVNEFDVDISKKRNRNKLAILSGSRKKEIQKMLVPMIKGANQFGKYPIQLAGAPSVPLEYYQVISQNTSIDVQFGRTHQILHETKLAIVKSGTSTLESALFLTPEVVCYKGSNISYQIAKRLVKVPYISLVNLIMDKPIVKELIQEELTADLIQKELETLDHPANYEKMISEFELLRNMLGNKGVSERIAERILEVVSTK